VNRGRLSSRPAIGDRALDADGAALVLTLLVVLLLTVLSGTLLTITSTETSIAANVEEAVQTLEAARSAAELVVAELSQIPDWREVLAGARTSALTDGAPGVRVMPDASAADLSVETSRLNCGQAGPCGAAQLVAVTSARPWGADNPVWVLFAHGSLAEVVRGAGALPLPYVAVWVADDPLETDGDPTTDGGGPPGTNPGAGLLMVHAEAWGASGSRQRVEATAARDPLRPVGLQVRSWWEGP
jgi:Tfp pilus assembly protein PilX